MVEVDWDVIEFQLSNVRAELVRATNKFGKFHNAHEGYAVLKEEVDELWDEIKKGHDTTRMREEAIQVCAMALRFLHDITPTKGDKNE